MSPNDPPPAGLRLANLRLPTNATTGTSSVSSPASAESDAPGVATDNPSGAPYRPPSLPKQQRPWHVWLIDDDPTILQGLAQLCRQHFAHALILTCLHSADLLQPDSQGRQRPLAMLKQHYQAESIDLVVIDMNLATGGYQSIDLIRMLRRWPKGRGLPIVLATGKEFVQVESGRIQVQNQLDGEPHTWNTQALEAGAEALLYGKQISQDFLVRLGEGMRNWQHLARRRAWASFAADLAQRLEAAQPDPDQVGAWMSQFLQRELAVDHAVVRWRTAPQRFRRLGPMLEAKADHAVPLAAQVQELDVSLIPVLARLLGPGRKPVREAQLTQAHCGARYPDGLLGQAYLGVAAFADGKPCAFISLIRRQRADGGHGPFDQIDEQGLQAVASLMGAGLERTQAAKQLTQRQQGLLDFARQITQARTRTPVCDAMLELLQQQVHDGNKDFGRVSCRLIDFGTGALKRKGEAKGYDHDRTPHAISLLDTSPGQQPTSVYARTVLLKDLQPNQDLKPDWWHVCLHDIQAPEYRGRVADTTQGKSRSELCVPLLVGGHAIGAVNLEHRDVGRYSEADIRFVHAVATVASQAITNASALAFSRSLLEFSNSYQNKPAQELQSVLRRVLYRLTGYSVLAELEASDPENPMQPWRAKSVFWALGGTTPQEQRVQEEKRIFGALNQAYQSHWPQPGMVPGAAPPIGATAQHLWLPSILAELVDVKYRAPLISDGRQAWIRHWVRLTEVPSDFLAVKLWGDWTQRADSVLWLRDRPDRPPSRALLLMWAVPPPIAEAQLELMAELAELFSALWAQARQVDQLVQHKLLGESQEKIGAVMQHFRHRLAGLVALLDSNFADLTRVLGTGRLDTAQALVAESRQVVRDIQQAYYSSRAYVKEVQLQAFNLAELVQRTLADPAWLARQKQRPVALHVEVAAHWVVESDPTLVGFALYTLLENAHEALTLRPERTGQAPAQIHIQAGGQGQDVWLDLADSGPGFPPDLRRDDGLFRYGATTKGQGLGSALAFAQARLAEAQARLSWAGNDGPGGGARFRIHLSASHRPAQALPPKPATSPH